MHPLSKGRYRVRRAAGDEDVARAQRLRSLAFRGGDGNVTGRDVDTFDARCIHILVEEAGSGALVCCFRLLPLRAGSEIGESYAAQYYELSALTRFSGPMVEMGRFCVHPDWRDPDILRLAWAALTAHVDREGVQMLFGCASFRGTEADRYADAFALLVERHLAPRRWWPKVKAPEVFRFAKGIKRARPDLRRAMLAMPPLLRSYLAMGGWVSDHAVIDRDLGTLHVFTGLEVGKVPATRARLLRAMAG